MMIISEKGIIQVNKKENMYLKFYREHNISPVSQQILDYEKHCKRRKNLYRQLGIPMLCFKGAKVLEVGAGGGYNTLPLFALEVEHIDIVEPNKKGIEDINALFSSYSIPENKYRIIDKLIEDIEQKEKYDFIIAEGFVQHLDNTKEILEVLGEFSHQNSIIIITCSDDIGLYVERMKRLVGNYLVHNINDYDKKVSLLVDIFKEQLKNLKGMSRPVIDWVQDQILNPVVQCEHLFSMKEAIDVYKGDYEVLGSSQSIFVDYSWYKDIEYNYKEEYMKQYDLKKHNFLFADHFEENIGEYERNDQLEKQIIRINEIARNIERTNTWGIIGDLVKELEILNEVTNINELVEFNNDLIMIIEYIKRNKLFKLDKFKKFVQSFGKTQQYISFSKI